MAGDYAEHEVEVLLREGALLINDGYRAKNSELSNTGIPFARAGNIDGGFRFDDADRVPAHTLAKVGLKRSRPGDVVFTSKGTVGRFAFVREGTPEFVYSPQLCYWRSGDVSRIHPRWLFYWMNGREFFLQFKGVAGQTDMAEYVSLRDQRAMKITLPPIAEQEAIAAVLGALDDKIELNRRMNATLEAMARALFQSWFVDFDPVRAKLDGRQPPNLDPATAALFPDSFDETAVGHIPHGWTATTLGDACEKGGGNIQTGPFGTQLHASDYVDEGIPSIMPSDLRDNRIETSSIARIREKDAKRLNVYRVEAGDVVYSRRGDVERRSLIRRSEHGWLCGTGCLRVRFGSRGLNPFFGASCLGTLESRAWVGRHAVGATMPNLNTSILGALPMLVPPPELQARFAEIVGPWDKRGTVALEQSRTLATLRDTLLPKLLSRQLSPKLVECDVEISI